MKQISFKTLLFFLVYACSINATNPQTNCQEPQDDDLQNVIDAERSPGERPSTYAPWRDSGPKKCPFCSEIADQNDEKHLILGRYKYNVVYVALKPYTNKGHLLIVPYAHVARLEFLETEALYELASLQDHCMRILNEVYRFTEFNAGFNFGKNAGASIPDHLHAHILPRWQGDAGFMQRIAGTEVASSNVGQVYETLRPYFARLKIDMNQNNLHSRLEN